ncbi:hypothetical protein D3C81_1713240 [compost metagenome]
MSIPRTRVEAALMYAVLTARMLPVPAMPLIRSMSRSTLPAAMASAVAPWAISLVRLICHASTVSEVLEVGCSTMPTE